MAGEDRPTDRLTSLDVFRGLVVVLLVLVEWVPPSPGASWLRHSPWNGMRIADVVFPSFLFMVGASASLATRTRWRRLVKRTLVLVVLGLLFNAWGDSGADLSHLRVPGVLQMIAIAGFLAGAITWFARKPMVVAAIAFAVVSVHGLLLAHAPLACGSGHLEAGCSLPWAVDRHVFGLAHLYTEVDRLGALTLAAAALAGSGVAALVWDRLTSVLGPETLQI